MSTDTAEHTPNTARTAIQRFKRLSRYHGAALYPGEHEFIADVVRRFDRSSFSELVQYIDANREKLGLPWELRRIWRLAKLSREQRAAHYANYAFQRIEAGQGDVRELKLVLDQVGFRDYSRPLRLLDLGTGRGSFLAAAQRVPFLSRWQLEGVDMDMASLLINLKLNEGLGNRNYNLTCCYGEKLPYDDNLFDIVASFQTLEHVGCLDQQVAFVREACRCLAPGGIAVFTFPNRFDILRPEPHVYIRLLGFVPQRWKNRISQALRGVPSGDVYPPSYRALLKSLQMIRGVRFDIHSSSEFSSRGVKKLIAGSRLYRMFGPWNVLVAIKGN